MNDGNTTMRDRIAAKVAERIGTAEPIEPIEPLEPARGLLLEFDPTKRDAFRHVRKGPTEMGQVVPLHRTGR